MAPPDGETQGGGQYGGPRRWTGKGPRPARHIPWPELFKHHQSVLTGHLKMMDMVRKHCVEGSGNHVTAQACVDRTHEMLRMFKKATATFVPPRDNIERVPLGASSASMYPGYSPADHIYGEAASEFGKQMAQLKKEGIELPKDPNGPEYDIAADKRAAQDQINEIKKHREQGKGAKQSGSQDGEAIAEPMEGVEETDPSQLFVIDSNPTPVAPFQANLPTSMTKSKNKANDKAKRRNSNEGDQTAESSEEPPKKKKKSKVSTDSTEPTEPAVDDFEAEVEAKHREKEEKRKAKKDKKRKRDSEPSELVADVPEVSVEESKVEKPKKKKTRKETADDDIPSVPDAADNITTKDGEKVKKRKKEDTEVTTEAADGDKKKKKVKKPKEDA